MLLLIMIMVATTALDREHHDVASCAYAWLRCRRLQAHQPPVTQGVLQRLGVSIPIQYTCLCKLADGGGQHLRYTTKLCRPGRLTVRNFEGTPRAQQLSCPSLRCHLSPQTAQRSPRARRRLQQVARLLARFLKHLDRRDHRAKFTSQLRQLGDCLENVDCCRKLCEGWNSTVVGHLSQWILSEYRRCWHLLDITHVDLLCIGNQLW